MTTRRGCGSPISRKQHLDDPAEAERLYLEVRRLQPEPGHEMRAANGLIDLYRKQGSRDRLMVELARFADRYRGYATEPDCGELASCRS